MSIYNTTNATNFAVDMADFGMTKTAFRNIQAYVPPRISIPKVENNIAGFADFHNASIPATKLVTDSFYLKILMDENNDAFNEIYRWMYTINPYGGKDIDVNIHGNVIEEISPDYMYVHHLDNTKRHIVSSHAFMYPWPSDIEIQEYNVTTNITYPMVMIVKFDYRMFQVYDSYNNLVKSRKLMKDITVADDRNGPNALFNKTIGGISTDDYFEQKRKQRG